MVKTILCSFKKALDEYNEELSTRSRQKDSNEEKTGNSVIAEEKIEYESRYHKLPDLKLITTELNETATEKRPFRKKCSTKMSSQLFSNEFVASDESNLSNEVKFQIIRPESYIIDQQPIHKVSEKSLSKSKLALNDLKKTEKGKVTEAKSTSCLNTVSLDSCVLKLPSISKSLPSFITKTSVPNESIKLPKLVDNKLKLTQEPKIEIKKDLDYMKQIDTSKIHSAVTRFRQNQQNTESYGGSLNQMKQLKTLFSLNDSQMKCRKNMISRKSLSTIYIRQVPELISQSKSLTNLDISSQNESFQNPYKLLFKQKSCETIKNEKFKKGWF